MVDKETRISALSILLSRCFGLNRKQSMSRPQIFLYHHVSESQVGIYSKRTISPVRFRRQMFLLRQRGFHCLTLSEVVTNILEGRPQPQHSFVLTFDDGYFDNYENALPILKELGLSATIFVEVQAVEDCDKDHLSWQQMKELTRNNITFGSHTMTHQRLSSLDEMTIKDELYRSRIIIEDRLGLPVDLLAYPYGDSNESVRDIARKIGYHAACGVTQGHFTRFNLQRVPIYGRDSLLTYYWKAYDGYSASNWLRQETWIGEKLRAIKRCFRKA